MNYRMSFVAAWLLLSTMAAAQESPPPAPDAAAPAATQPADGVLLARVLEVRGDSKHAPLDSTQWQPCQVGDTYPPETQILTGVRSSVKLRIGEDDTYTAVIVEPASRVHLSELLRTADTKRVRLEVGYGQVRAGVAEGTLKSDFTVDSPVATLSKRGTWNFGLFYERGTDRFDIFLLEDGLVDAFSKQLNVERSVLPGERVDETMARWLDAAPRRLNVPVPDIFGQGDIEVAFNALQNSGLRVLNPQGGSSVLINLSTQFSQNEFRSVVRDALPLNPGAGTVPPARREGFFGSGRGDELIPVFLGTDNPLVQKGYAKPGTYRFPRPVLENWLRNNGGR
ncbi:MAG: hypothetical protein IPM18_13355 [Phycisphaerales bacterium]|nr:hypothetical protein [Phycisphaerales bacterium]